MTSYTVIERFNVVEHILLGQVAGFVGPLSDAFLFQTTEKRLGNGVIPAVASPAHTGAEVMGTAEQMPVITSILTPLIGVHEHRLARPPAPDCHQ